MTSKSQVPITDATIEVYKKDGTLVGSATPEGGGNYVKETLEEGDYYFKAMAPGRGTVIKDFKLPSDTPSDEAFKNITVNMYEGVPLINVHVEDKNETDVIDNIAVKLARIEAPHNLNGNYEVENVPIGTQVLEIIPDEGYEETYQHYKKEYHVSSGLSINEVLYPPVTVRVRIVNAQGVDIPGAQLYEGSSVDPAKEITRTSGQLILPLQADRTITFTARATNYVTRTIQRVISYKHTMESGSDGNQIFLIELQPQFGETP